MSARMSAWRRRGGIGRALHRAAKRAPAAAFAAIVIAGCTLPPFDEEVAMRALLIDQLDHRLEIGTFDICEADDVWYRSPRFIPNRAPEPEEGIVAFRSDAGFGLHKIGSDASIGHGLAYSGGDRFGLLVEPIVRQSLPAGDSPVLYFIAGVPGGATDLFVKSLTPGGDVVDIGAGEYSSTTVASAVLAGGFDATVGASVFPQPGAAEPLHLLLLDNNTGEYAEVEVPVDDLNGVGAATRVLFTFTHPDFDFENAFYHHDAGSERSYASVYDGGGHYESWVWYEDPDAPGTMRVEELPFSRRIDRLLSTGELLSVGATTTVVYDDDGDRINSYPHGSLEPAFELDTGGRQELFLTDVFLAQADEDESNDCLEAAFNAYAVDSGDVGDLGN